MIQEETQTEPAAAKPHKADEPAGPTRIEFPDTPDDALSRDEMEALYAQTFQNTEQGAIVQGTIIGFDKDQVTVDVGFKSEGVISTREFRRSGAEDIHVGDVVDLYLEQVEDDSGQVVLSKEKADKIKIWNKIEDFFEKGEALEGRVIARIKGGLSVDLGGIKAFLPGSQVDIRPVRNLDKVIGQTLEMKVIKMNQARGNIVLSRRQLLEEERTGLKDRILDTHPQGRADHQGRGEEPDRLRRVRRSRWPGRPAAHHRHLLGAHRPSVAGV